MAIDRAVSRSRLEGPSKGTVSNGRRPSRMAVSRGHLKAPFRMAVERGRLQRPSRLEEPEIGAATGSDFPETRGSRLPSLRVLADP